MATGLYSESEDQFIRAHFRKMRLADMAASLGRSPPSVRNRAKRLGANRPLVRWSSREDAIIRQSIGVRQLRDVAAELGRNPGAVVARTKTLGLGKWRRGSGRHSGRLIDGFRKGQPIFAHRTVMAQALGRELASTEIVHHIDCDKDNNRLDNLHLFPDRAEHRRAHSSFENLVPQLLQMGLVRFNRETGRYELAMGA